LLDYDQKIESWSFEFFEEYIDDEDSDEYFIEYEWILEDEKEEVLEFFESVHVTNYNHELETFEEEKLNNNSEILDNLYFFERFVGLSNEILDRMYFKRRLKSIKKANLRKKLFNSFNSLNIAFDTIDKDFFNIFHFYKLNNFYTNNSKVGFLKVDNLKQLLVLINKLPLPINDELSFYIIYFKVFFSNYSPEKIKLEFKQKTPVIPIYNSIIDLNLYKYRSFYNWINSTREFVAKPQKLIQVLDSKHSQFPYLFFNDVNVIKNTNLFLLLNYNKKKIYLPNFLNLDKLYNLFYFKELVKFNSSFDDDFLEFISQFFDHKFFLKVLNDDQFDSLITLINEKYFFNLIREFFEKSSAYNNSINYLSLFYFLFLKFSKPSVIYPILIKYKKFFYKLLAKSYNALTEQKSQFIFLELFNEYFYNLGKVETADFHVFSQRKKIDFKTFFPVYFFKSNFLCGGNKTRRNLDYFKRGPIGDAYSIYLLNDPLENQFFLTQRNKEREFTKSQKVFTIKQLINFKNYFSISNFYYLLFFFIPRLLNVKNKNYFDSFYLSNNLNFYKNKIIKLLHTDFNLNLNSSDFLYFPFLNHSLKKSDEKKIFFEELDFSIYDNISHINFISYIYLKKVNIKFLNSFSFFRSNIDFLFILDILNIFNIANTSSVNVLKDLNSYNLNSYKIFFIKFLLRKNNQFKIKNLKTFKKTLTSYYYEFFDFDFSRYNFIKIQSELNLYDYEILNSLFNKYWSYGYDGPISEEFFQADRSVIGSQGYVNFDLISMNLSEGDYTVIVDYYPTNWLEFASTLIYLEHLLHTHPTDEDEYEELDHHKLVWGTFFFSLSPYAFSFLL
jgi:hypothetical protein